MLPWQEFADHAANDRCATQTTAHQHLKAEFTRVVFDQVQSDVMDLNGSTIFGSSVDGNLEFAG